MQEEERCTFRRKNKHEHEEERRCRRTKQTGAERKTEVLIGGRRNTRWRKNETE